MTKLLVVDPSISGIYMRVPPFLSAALLFSLIMLALIVVVYFTRAYPGDLQLEALLFAALAGLSNTLLALVAFLQLPALERTNKAAHETTKASFLLSLTEKWMHEDIIQARCLLYHQALIAPSKDVIPESISHYLIELSQNPEPIAIRQFAQIISLLEFMETLAGLHSAGQISLDMLQKLFGGSIERYYYYLNGYIAFRRLKGSPPGITFVSDQSLYTNYENLVKSLIFEGISDK